MNLKEGVLHSVMLGSSFIFFFHLMLGVTHLLLEKDFSSANLTELRNNRDTMQDFQGIFKIHVLMTIIHGDIKHIPTRVIRPAFWMLVS